MSYDWRVDSYDDDIEIEIEERIIGGGFLTSYIYLDEDELLRMLKAVRTQKAVKFIEENS